MKNIHIDIQVASDITLVQAVRGSLPRSLITQLARTAVKRGRSDVLAKLMENWHQSFLVLSDLHMHRTNRVYYELSIKDRKLLVAAGKEMVIILLYQDTELGSGR